MEIKSNLISNTRLINQKIAGTDFKTPKEIVSWMGAIQAQDYSMALWAIGTRLSGSTKKTVESSFDNGEILRIHVLRPTWHFISADDIYWMLQLSSIKIKSSLKTRHFQLGLTEPVISKTIEILEKELANGSNLTREELASEFGKAGIKTDENRLSHILFRAEMDGIICSGPIKDKKQTYSLLYERVPHKTDFSRNDALAELAKRYFKSRCPATSEDFAWWSNLSAADVRKALDFIRSDFFCETIKNSKYWFPNSYTGGKLEKNSVNLLPAYDEFLISYKDRSRSLSAVNNKKTVSDNGIFYPIIVVNGQVAGVWKRKIQKNKVILETDFFRQPDLSVIKRLKIRALSFGRFLDKEIEMLPEIYNES